MQKIEVTWQQYISNRDEIWSKHFANTEISHEERADRILADLQKMTVIKNR